VGERSFGKGSVQHLILLKEHEAAIKLTTAYYRMPDDRIIHRTAANESLGSWGVIPDIEVPLSDREVQEIQEVRREMDLAFTETSTAPGGTAPGGTPDAGGRAEPTPNTSPANDATFVSPESPLTQEITRDRQLLEALSYLRQRCGGDVASR
jgi:hypothetical protein